MAHQPQPDWADLLAKEWIDQLREIYRNRGYDGTPSKPLVIKTGKELVKPIDKVFGQTIDYSGPDYAMREALKRNVWKFSVAKNDNDNKRLSNLLLKEDGNLRPWNEFKREALKVVGTSNRYLKTEYDTIVAGAQMSRLWQEIQRDKHIFPFVQFDVVQDERTSDICKPLHKVIMKVEDPRLAYYFPPNHFNCRTTVRKLRNGVPTENVELPEIPEAFMNNVGMCPKGYEELSLSAEDKKPPKREACGEIFTNENAYIKNTDEEVQKIANDLYRESFKEASIEVREQLERYKLKYPFYEKTNHPNVEMSFWADRTETKRNIEIAKVVANFDKSYIKIRPHIDGEILKNMPNPEYDYNGVLADRKSPEGINLKNVFRSAQRQGTEVVIFDLENNTYSTADFVEAVHKRLAIKGIYPKLRKVIIVSKNMEVQVIER